MSLSFLGNQTEHSVIVYDLGFVSGFYFLFFSFVFIFYCLLMCLLAYIIKLKAMWLKPQLLSLYHTAVHVNVLYVIQLNLCALRLKCHDGQSLKFRAYLETFSNTVSKKHLLEHFFDCFELQNFVWNSTMKNSFQLILCGCPVYLCTIQKFLLVSIFLVDALKTLNSSSKTFFSE